MKTIATILFAGLLTAGPVAAAEEKPGVFNEGWYVAPTVLYMQPDSGRCNVDGGVGGAVALGNRGEFASLEAWGQFLSLSHGGCTYTIPAPTDTDPDARATVVEPGGTLKLNGGGLGIVFGPFFEGEYLSRVYAVTAAGVTLRENHPQFPKDTTNIFVDAGAGYLHPFELFGLPVNLRTDLRYRFDIQQPPHANEQDPAPATEFGDIIFNLGLQIPLFQGVEPEPAPAEPLGVVKPAYADTDGDGVIDDRDQCPDTPAGSYVDNIGCPKAVAPPPPEPVEISNAKAGDRIVLKGVTFETNSEKLRVNAETILDGVAESLTARPELRVEVGGHTDDRGSDSYNQDLSQRRADSVLEYLVGRGIERDRLTAVGYGEAQPVDSNDSSAGRERNRRVELKVLD